ncbi:ABC transporter substrate-binding protein [Actinophytocola xinjiangensis]|jgi:sulfonate transport system substrate-binding protein|uniref:Putative aliphatic sulfonates-binding protein n=1 Tax=Actinophytocola xinjiangensis TaxID=485602 RepID=A0A7Z0WNS4_9PSEU|nr:aliphatic sulfonate ABC transporter substrate-binding protein [Actinophytocola xinjiangensis]OLF11956.1 ABC transporter substrate-binding protein [Actinophytocola xinjiangensis]
MRHLRITAATALLALALTSCVAGEDAGGDDAGTGEWSGDTLNIDFATYNPLSLVIREQGWLEEELTGVTVTWTQSAGSNKANEGLRSAALDVGSTAGSAALLARANGTPIKVIDIYSQPEWSAIVVPGDSDIDEVADLKGRSIAATKGTDPYFFLLQTLAEAGVPLNEVEVQNLQHADGRTAMDNGSVDAWSGLDPIMAAAQAESGAKLIYRNIDFNTYGFLNAREEFLTDHPDLAQAVVDAYERARAWALEHPEELVTLLADVGGISPEVAATVLDERTVLDLDPVPGEAQRKVLAVVGPIFVESGDVASQSDVDLALDELIEPGLATKATDG